MPIGWFCNGVNGYSGLVRVERCYLLSAGGATLIVGQACAKLMLKKLLMFNSYSGLVREELF